MVTMWNARAAQSIRARITRLAPECHAAWGRMTAPVVVCHLAETLKLAIGELHVASMNTPVRFPPLKQLIVYWAPFPKNAPTAPEVIARAPGEWKADIAELQGLVDRLCARGADVNAVWPVHPAFGRLSRRAWGVHVYRHIDHHLRQFGV
jgi:hypothetical protein